jgi:Skp family chaperone for outer membrane proteins
VVDKELEDYRKQALDLWFSDGGSCTGHSPTEEQDDRNLDDEFKRIEREKELKEKEQVRNLTRWP